MRTKNDASVPPCLPPRRREAFTYILHVDLQPLLSIDVRENIDELRLEHASRTHVSNVIDAIVPWKRFTAPVRQHGDAKGIEHTAGGAVQQNQSRQRFQVEMMQ
jgi:hypothetical protein